LSFFVEAMVLKEGKVRGEVRWMKSCCRFQRWRIGYLVQTQKNTYHPTTLTKGWCLDQAAGAAVAWIAASAATSRRQWAQRQRAQRLRLQLRAEAKRGKGDGRSATGMVDDG